MVCWGHRDEKSKKFKKYDAYAKRQFRLSLKDITGRNSRRPEKKKKKNQLLQISNSFHIKNPKIPILLGDFVRKKAPGWLNL